MKYIFFLFLFLFSINFANGQTRYKHRLSEEATIDFPQTPTLVDTLGQKTYVFNNDSASFIVIVTNISLTTDFRIKPGKIGDAYNGIIRGVIKSANAELIQKKNFKIEGLDAVEIEYASTNSGLPDRRFKRVIIFNNKIYDYNFWTTSTFKDLTAHSREVFFNSFSITADKKTLRQDNDNAFQSGYEFGYYIVAPVLIIAVLVVIAYFIFRKKKVRK